MFKPATVFAAAMLALATSGPALATEPTVDTVVAVVNGHSITLGHMIAAREALPRQYLDLEDQELFDGILEQIIQQSALADSVGDDLTKRDVLSLDNQRRTYLAGAALDAVADAAVTEATLQALYDEKYGSAAPGKEFNAAHILVATEEEAQALKEELDGGADFTALAKEKSTGPSGPNGGDLGWFGIGMMVKPFEDAVIAMEPGQVSDPVQTQFGWHLIKLIETRTAEAPALADTREELAGEIRSRAVEARVLELTKAATVERTTDGIDPAILKNTALIDD